jgi:hypothetical protein
MHGADAAADEPHDAALGTTDKQQQQQQQIESTAHVQHTATAHVALGGLSAPVMPSFPARQPLHHTIVRRPRSGLEQQQQQQQQQQGTAGAVSSTRRPASAAPAMSQSTSVQLQLGRSAVRPATAACPEVGALGQQQQGLRRRPATAAGPQVEGALRRPGSSSNNRKSVGVRALDRPGCASSEHAWKLDASAIAASFLAKS